MDPLTIRAPVRVTVKNISPSGIETGGSLFVQPRKLNIFIDKGLCSSVKAASLNPVLAFHWEGLSTSEIAEGKFNPSSPFVGVEHLAKSDICVLPGIWNHYFWHDRMGEAITLARQARQHGKKILIWFSGDLPPVIPLDNALVFQCGGDRSRGEQNRHAAPFFIDDPLRKYGDGKVDVRKKGPKPVIGFCGYAAMKPMKLAYALLANMNHNLSCMLGRAKYGPTPLVPATLLRARALNVLSRDERADCRFIIRDRYRAGFRRGADQSLSAAHAAREFFNNILDTDYTVCLRGNGNWSVRFYETLACGRIPIFIDTDCVLPFEFAVDWKKYCVWVDRSDVSRIADVVSDFHNRLSSEDFIELQLRCRRLWEERLSLSGFMRHLSQHFVYSREIEPTC
jgi:hypothetical protein